jgi:hypothetical protein
MTELTAKGTGEVGSKVIVTFPLMPVFVAPQGFYVPWFWVPLVG